MGQMNVEQFASELGVTAALLLEQLRAAGVHKSADNDVLTEQDKKQLLDHLRRSHGGGDEIKGKIISFSFEHLLYITRRANFICG